MLRLASLEEPIDGFEHGVPRTILLFGQRVSVLMSGMDGRVKVRAAFVPTQHADKSVDVTPPVRVTE